MPDQSDDTPAQLPKHKVKYKMPLQRACNEKDEKGKLCGGHLKRWFYLADVIEQGCGDVRRPLAITARCIAANIARRSICRLPKSRVAKTLLVSASCRCLA